MTDFTMTEIEAQHVELLPTKETLLWFNFGNVANVAASNASYAVNAATICSSATSAAVQNIYVVQG